MNDTIIFGNWQGFKDKGLAPRELEATVLAAGDLTIKQIAKHMGVSPWTAKIESTMPSTSWACTVSYTHLTLPTKRIV